MLKRRLSGHGLGLIELALALAISALMVAGAVVYYHNADQRLRANTTIQAVLDVRNAAAALYGGQPDYQGISEVLIARSRLLPSKWVKGDMIYHPFIGQLWVDSRDYENYAHVHIKLRGIKAQDCVSLLTMPFDRPLLRMIYVKEWNEGTGQNVIPPITPQQAINLCPSGSRYELEYIFR